MDNQDYVIDRKRGMAWGHSYEALEWYRNELDRLTWQPIETAPKDGSWILLSGGVIDYGWNNDEKPSSVVGQWAAGPACWQFAWYDGGYYGEYENPTHWMPLPKA